MTSSDRRPDLSDDDLLAALGRALQESDPVPERVVAGARGAVAWRTIDQELADLVFDSAMEATGVRDRDAARQLTFQAPGIEIEVMLVDDGTRRLVGQLVPARSTIVTLETTDERHDATADRFGRFSFERVHAGPIRISVAATADSPAVTTDWVLF